MSLKQIFEDFIKDYYNIEPFFKSTNEVRFLHPNKDLRKKFNDFIIEQVKDELIDKFTDYCIKKEIEDIPVYTVTISDENPDFIIVILGF